MKRKAATLVYDTKLQRVVRALENVTRVGATFASGSSERFPLPGLAFKGDKEELYLPLGAIGAETIKARATASQQQRHSIVDEEDGLSAAAWEVDGASLELRNPRWRAFLHEQLDAMRAPLGIAPTATLRSPLRKMVLLETGARLCLKRKPQEQGKINGVFGSFVVALPSEFEGGNVDIRQRSRPHQQQAGREETKDDGGGSPTDEETTTWRSGAREHVYDITYAAFYDHCDYVAEPVASGAALYLVYDLVATMLSEVPLVAGPNVVQEAVEGVLSDYFDVMSAPLAKRLKISDDASRTINEFAVERPFVYIVGTGTWDRLTRDEFQIAQSLQAFCAQSGGQYVLYLVGVSCTRLSVSKTSAGDFSDNPSDDFFNDDSSDDSWPRLRDKSADESADDGLEELRVSLREPWLKFGDSLPSSCPPVLIRHCDDVAPLGHLSSIATSKSDYYYSRAPDARALVVLPIHVAQRQLANVPIREATAKLHGLLPESRGEATQYARSIIQYCFNGILDHHYSRSWNDFINVLVEINDRLLFDQLLLAIDFDSDDHHELLRDALLHFGWEACLDTMVRRVLATSSLCSRVHFVVSVVYEDLEATRITPLLDALLSLYPWTDVRFPHGERCLPELLKSAIPGFRGLLALASRMSLQQFQQVALIPRAEETVWLSLPAVVDMVWGRVDQSLYPAFVDMSSHAHDKIFQTRNAPFAGIRLLTHCRKCSELQLFLSSTATETTVRYTGSAKREHIEEVLESATEHCKTLASVKIEPASAAAVRLTKEWQAQYKKMLSEAKGTVSFLDWWLAREKKITSHGP